MPCQLLSSDVETRGSPRPLPHHLVCVEKFTLPYLTWDREAAVHAMHRQMEEKREEEEEDEAVRAEEAAEEAARRRAKQELR